MKVPYSFRSSLFPRSETISRLQTMHQTTVNVMLLSAFIFLLAFKVGLFGI